jgi:hypothetical protein
MGKSPVRTGRLRAVARRCATAVAFVAGASMAACATSGSVGQRAAMLETESSVVIQNNSWEYVTVYVQRNGTLWRVGDVEAMGKARFSMARFGFMADGGSTSLVARPLAGQAFQSESFIFPVGRTAVWTIENQSAFSHVVVR